jgi:guanine deaminase
MDNPDFSEKYYVDPSTQESIDLNKEVISYIHSIDPQGTMVKPIITPRFALTCTPKAMQGLADLAASYDPPLHIQTHISENTQEIHDVHTQFPDAKSYADVYDTYGLLTPRTILAHGVHLTPDEQDLIHDREAKISHCPASNSALGSGICPVRKLWNKGITVGLGTDVSGGYSPSILEAVRQACLVSRLLRHVGTENGGDKGKELVLSVEEGLYLATRGGAAVVNMENDIGGFDIGMLFDAQLIRLGPFLPACKYDNGESRVDIFGWEKWQEKVHKWVWSGDDRNVKGVWVGGRLVYGEDDVEGGNRPGWWSWVLSAGVVGVGAVVAFRRMRL